jgi:3-phosphoshikimate 1-carboxyvinyltransferase
MGDLSDVAQTLAVVAPFARTKTRVTGIGFIRHKERRTALVLSFAS